MIKASLIVKLIANFGVICLFLTASGCAVSKKVSVPERLNRVVTVEGQAKIINNAQILARKQAFSNALRQASTKLGLGVDERLLGNTKVVDEWIKDNTYHLQLLTVLSTDKFCHAPYRKKLVATAFPIVTAGQIAAHESQDLYSGIPREIVNILMESGDFIGINATHSVLYDPADMAPEIKFDKPGQQSIVVQMAQQYHAQFVLSGVIRDFEVESTEYIRGGGALAQIKSLMRDFVARRGVALDIYIHNGIDGTLLFQHRYTNTVTGDVWIPSGYTVGSERFKATPSGQVISSLIQLASQDIRRLFSCYPLVSEIIKVEHDKIYIAAGTQTKLKEGDYLSVYSRDFDQNLSTNTLVGVVKIVNIQSQFAVGTMALSADLIKVRAGDLVKSW